MQSLERKKVSAIQRWRSKKVAISIRHRIILALTLLGICLMIWGVAFQGWDYNQMGVMFFCDWIGVWDRWWIGTKWDGSYVLFRL
ncbi:hypothetical protein [Algoriphagus boritolerans]|uniref:hypothetical protein n=1 Tax=Algoriphagus boritolerans TaxID=308111 RepID=UPI000B1EC794